MTNASEDLRYPIGPFRPATSISSQMRASAIAAVSELPARMRAAVQGLGDRQIDTPYRPNGWTVRQLVHHVADSHMNGFIRVKLALAEEAPAIKPYDENVWARLPDSSLPVAPSLELLDALHTRWVALYRAMTTEQFDRTFFHPELGEQVTLDEHLQNYAWHSRHHVAHITELRRREGW